MIDMEDDTLPCRYPLAIITITIEASLSDRLRNVTYRTANADYNQFLCRNMARDP